jgi:type III pantothenate kinase
MPRISVDLVVDVGNTRVKVALFRGGRLVRRGWIDEDPGSAVHHFLQGTVPDAIALGAVGPVPNGLEDALQRIVPVHRITGAALAPVRSAYGSPLTLGVDRLANAVGGHRMFPGRPVLVIDLGSCITCDLVDASGTYLGGSISPGLHMRARALHAYSAALPMVEVTAVPQRMGTDTRSSLLSGLYYGVRDELRAAVDAFTEPHPGLAVVLTGGDAPRMMGGLKSGIFADPSLTLHGLHAILEHHRRLSATLPGAVPGTGAGPAG